MARSVGLATALIGALLPLTGTLLLWTVSDSSAQTYLPGPAPTIGDIQHQTTSSYNPSRTDIGIGESVNCWIDPATWLDPDVAVDAYGNQTTVYDTMGTIVWEATGAGVVEPIVGNRVIMMADLADADGTITVRATIHDSGKMGLDPPLVKTLAFK